MKRFYHYFIYILNELKIIFNIVNVHFLCNLFKYSCKDTYKACYNWLVYSEKPKYCVIQSLKGDFPILMS